MADDPKRQERERVSIPTPCFIHRKFRGNNGVTHVKIIQEEDDPVMMQFKYDPVDAYSDFLRVKIVLNVARNRQVVKERYIHIFVN